MESRVENIYRTIKIQDLEVRDIPEKYLYTSERAQQNILSNKCDHYGHCTCHLLAYIENSEANFSNHSNSFFGAFLLAYDNHKDIILSPDDIWLVICIHLSRYVNDNAESLRKHFVNHDGKKQLTVPTVSAESEWNEFFTLMIEQIKLNTTNSVCDILEANFSTTGPVEKLISNAVIMDFFKQYFDYTRCTPCCGIRNIKFMGKLSDWISLIDKFKKLESFTLDKPDDSFKSYIKNLVPILEKFVDTYNNKVDLDFWNRIMNLNTSTQFSNTTTYISGWILKFFGIESMEVESNDIPSYTFEFPVKIDNKLTSVKKTVMVMGGFGEIHMDLDADALRPQQYMAIYHDGVTFD